MDNSGGESGVVLSADRESLAQFVSYLLKQPLRIERVISNKKFVIDHLWLMNLLEICNQRLRQNPHSLVSFKCIIHYEDGYRFSLDSPVALQSFHSTRQVLTTGFDMSFSYLIEFAGAAKPEKQDIRVRVQTATRSGDLNSSIYLGVACSDLTWGEDIVNHLSNHIGAASKSSILVDILSFFRKQEKPITIFVTVIFLIGFMFFLRPSPDKFLTEAELKRISSLPMEELKTIGEKMNALFLFQEKRSHFQIGSVFVFFPALVIIPLFLPDLIRAILAKFTRSFVILNDFTKLAYDQDQDKNNRLKWILIGAAITVPLGVVATIIKAYIF